MTDTVQKVCESFKCKPIEGMLSHQLKQFKIDGEKTIIQNPSDAQKKEHEKFEFATHEVYAMDVLVSTGDGVVSFMLEVMWLVEDSGYPRIWSCVIGNHSPSDCVMFWKTWIFRSSAISTMWLTETVYCAVVSVC